MSDDLVRQAGRVFFGSAVAGAGLSFGRDIYKSVKNNLGLIIVVAVFFGFISLPYFAGRKSYVWQPNRLGWFFLVFLPWHIVGIIGGLFLLVVSLFFVASEEEYKYIGLMIGGLYVAGALIAISKNSAIKNLFLVEEKNKKFLDEIGLEEIDAGGSFNHRDQDGNMLKLNSIGKDIIEFIPVGTRSKRAYITIDKNGFFSNYSGIISLK